ncbi:hypothetical protein C8T65DRAFT_699610 [Cerioporus squamosus]|nr:hypothetical protein C8T65DRAFT_699610 [Cerioporus squamosus]
MDSQDPADRARAGAASPPGRTIETFSAVFFTEVEGGTNSVEAKASILLLSTETARDRRAALIVSKVDTGAILFQEIIEQDWNYWLHSLQGVPEFQWAIYRNRDEDYQLYWLYFDSWTSRGRFHALFEIGPVESVVSTIPGFGEYNLPPYILEEEASARLPAYPASDDGLDGPLAGRPPSYMESQSNITAVPVPPSLSESGSDVSPGREPFVLAPRTGFSSRLIPSPGTSSHSEATGSHERTRDLEAPQSTTMDPPKDIIPIFASYAAVYSFAAPDSDIDTDVKWEYCSVLISILEGAIRALFVNQDACGLCGFAGKWITSTVFVSNMSLRMSQKDRIVSWQLPGHSQRVQVRFCLEKDFWWFINEFSDGMLVSGKSKGNDEQEAQIGQVHTHYRAYLRLGCDDPELRGPLKRFMEGWPLEEDMRLPSPPAWTLLQLHIMNEPTGQSTYRDSLLTILGQIRVTIGRLNGDWSSQLRLFLGDGGTMRMPDLERRLQTAVAAARMRDLTVRTQAADRLRDLARRAREEAMSDNLVLRFRSVVKAINSVRARCNQVKCETPYTTNRWLITSQLGQLLRVMAVYIPEEERERLASRMEFCRQKCAAARTEERSIRYDFMESSESRKWEELEQLCRHAVALRRERRASLQKAVETVTRALRDPIQVDPDLSDAAFLEAMAILANIRCRLRGQTADQVECLTAIQYSLESGSERQYVLRAPCGDLVQVDDIQNTLPKCDAIHSSLERLSEMLHNVSINLSQIRAYFEDGMIYGVRQRLE